MAEVPTLAEYIAASEPKTFEEWIASRPTLRTEIDRSLPSAPVPIVHRYLKQHHAYPLGEDTIKRYKRKLTGSERA